MPATITECLRLNNDEASTSGGADQETATYLVTVSEKWTTPLAVKRATHADMPAMGSQHDDDPTMYVVNKTARRAPASNGKPSMYHWHVVVVWGPRQISGGPTGDTENSSNIRVSVSGAEERVYTQTQRDADPGTPIRNAVGDMYPDPQEVSLYDEVINIEFESDDFDPEAIAEARGRINSSPVVLTLPQGNKTFSRTFDNHKLLLEGWDYDVVVSLTDNATHVWGHRVVLRYRPDGWKKKLPEKGYRWFDDTSGTNVLTEWKDSPEYLTDGGFKLPTGSSLVSTAPVQLNWGYDLNSLLSTI